MGKNEHLDFFFIVSSPSFWDKKGKKENFETEEERRTEFRSTPRGAVLYGHWREEKKETLKLSASFLRITSLDVLSVPVQTLIIYDGWSCTIASLLFF